MLSPVALILTATIAQGGDFWNDKQPAKWTVKEAHKLMARSPWAKEATMQFAGRNPDTADGDDSERSRRSAQRQPAPGGGTMGDNSGGAGPLGDVTSMPTLLVRWESAKPIREAESKLEMEMPDRADEFYMLSVSWFPLQGRDPSPGIKERLIAAAALKIKGKDPIPPADVEVIEGDKGILVVYFFPRKDAIQAADKEVIFEMNNGPSLLQVKFPLKDMKFGGELAL